MIARKRLLPALVATAIAAAAPASQAAQFTGFYVFGDSLADAGFYRPYLSSLGLPAPLVSTLGRFTTNPGPVWSELVSTYYGFPPAPSNVAGGNIFAQGGARVTENSASTPPGFAQRPVRVQIDEYLTQAGGHADPNALYAVVAGGNDFLQNFQAFAAGQITQAQLQANVLAAATAEVGQVARLQAAGARYILAFSLPDIGLAPSSQAGGPTAVAGATALSVGYNTTFFTGLQSTGIKVIPVDTFALLTDIKTNAASFGITNTTGLACGPFPPVTTTPNSLFCLPQNYVTPNAATTYMFADGVHPTSIVHRITADFVLSLIEGPTQYGLLADAAMRARNTTTRMLNDGFAQVRDKDPGTWNVFVAGDVADAEIDTSPGNAGFNGKADAHALGLAFRASEGVTMGVSFGQDYIKASFGMDGGNFRMREKVWSLFGTLRHGGFWGTAVASISDLDFTEVRRNIHLANVVRTANTSTHGTNTSGSLFGGYDFTFGRFQVGPTIGVTAQDVSVNGFDEAAAQAGSAALRIYEQRKKSEVWSIGGRASLQLGAWTPWLQVTADKERRDDERFVSATPISMVAIGNKYDIPAYVADSTYVTSTLGVRGWLMPQLSLSAAVYNVSGRSGTKETGGNLLLGYHF